MKENQMQFLVIGIKLTHSFSISGISKVHSSNSHIVSFFSLLGGITGNEDGSATARPER